MLCHEGHESVLPSPGVSSELESHQDLRTHLGMEGLLGMNPKSETYPDLGQSAGLCFGADRNVKGRHGTRGT